MKIEIIPCLNDNYSYLIHDEISNTVAIVDPSEFIPCDTIISKNYKKLDFILNTHHHYDHVGGNEELKKKYNSKVLGFENDKNRIPQIDTVLKDNQEFKIGTLNFTTIFIPGHTRGHVAFYFKKERVVFSGDTLFSLGCGRVFEGTYKQMFQSLNKLKNLPGETKVYCGHEYTFKNLEFCLKFNPNNDFLKKKKDDIKLSLKNKKPTIPSTIADEIKANIFFRVNDPDVKKAINLENSPDIEIFTKLRDLKDNF
ncbi:hydroxyacylglutathione hydrolase [Candidatus Pelagibacter bacterium]|jgi:hydroxyacylglutathione hydrolase|nr:hydroxyacylglutathione hydrolase [Candidatus Pelagibacter bacterium]MDC0858836.1 hydroxyacylglutathione hydrolase [Pelagibacteraceae bacterium]